MIIKYIFYKEKCMYIYIILKEIVLKEYLLFNS